MGLVKVRLRRDDSVVEVDPMRAAVMVKALEACYVEEVAETATPKDRGETATKGNGKGKGKGHGKGK